MADDRSTRIRAAVAEVAAEINAHDPEAEDWPWVASLTLEERPEPTVYDRMAVALDAVSLTLTEAEENDAPPHVTDLLEDAHRSLRRALRDLRDLEAARG